MYDYSICPDDLVFFIDMKSFYASVSCVMMGLDPLKTKLAVVGDTKRTGSIILACTPLVKAMGYSTSNRMWELPNDKELHIVNPSMGKYVDISNRISELMMTKYCAPVDFYQYSIDEFLIVFSKKYTKLHKKEPFELAQTIQQDIFDHFGLTCTVGIGPNILMAKLALSGAKNSSNGIAHWTYADIPTKVWTIKPLSKFWGIAKKTEQKLNKLGITTIGELAKYPLPVLIQRFGNVMGNELHLHANGIDFSKLGEMNTYKPRDTSLGKSHVLLRDYQPHEVKTLILEQLEEVCYRLRRQDQLCRTIHFGIGYSSGSGGFSRSVTVNEPSELTMDWYKVCLKILEENYTNEPIRTISIALKNFVKKDFEQITFMSNPIKRQKETNLTKTMDAIRTKYGKNSLLRACSYLDQGTIRSNNNKIGGHYA